MRAFLSKTKSGLFSASAKNALGRAVGITAIGGSIGLIAYMNYIVHGPREKEVRARAFDPELLRDTNSAVQTDANVFRSAVEDQRAAHGTLHNALLRNSNTGNVYLKKGAASRKRLLDEFVISNALALVRPGVQPESLILQDDLHEDGTARFYTLSRIYPNTVDVEDFIKAGDSVPKITSKPVVGFEQALAADGMFAKQQDCKLANLIITDQGHQYEVSTIDHEFAGESFFSLFNRQIFTTDLDVLIGFLRDLHKPEEGIPNIGMVGDERAVQFMQAAKAQMKPEVVREFYKRVAATDFKPLINQLELMSRHSDLVSKRDVISYERLLTNLTVKAAEYVQSDRVTVCP